MDINPTPKTCAAKVWLVSKSVAGIALKNLCTGILVAGLVSLAMSSTNAQVLTNTWTLAGGGLNPTNYGNNFRPATLVSDTGSTGTATIAMSGLTSGGLGTTNPSNPGPYGGIYAFLSRNLALNLQVSNVSAGLSEISLTFLAGGGSPVLSYTNNSLSLNFNATNPATASSSFTAVSGFEFDSPVMGTQILTSYNWTWTNLSRLGSSSSFSIAWAATNQHSFITDVRVTQVIPEPSTSALLGIVVLAGSFLLFRRRLRLLGGK